MHWLTQVNPVILSHADTLLSAMKTHTGGQRPGEKSWPAVFPSPAVAGPS